MMLRRATLVMLGWIAMATVSRAGEVEVRWLEGAPAAGVDGVTWGMPWPQGQYPKDTTFALRGVDGAAVPLQSWPLATWPDGSLKWSAHATGALPAPTASYTLAAGAPAVSAAPLTVTEEENAFLVDTGALRCRLPKSGATLIESLQRADADIIRAGRLVLLRRDQAEMETNGVWREEAFVGDIAAVTVEQRGPLRAVIRIEGMHTNDSGRRWLPFVVRLYFHAGSEALRIMHTIVFDGDENTDFISGLGLRFAVPMRGEAYDRHVRFVGDGAGVFGEAVQGITGLRRDPGKAVREAQVAGRATPPPETWDRRVTGNLHYVPAFGDYSLTQLADDFFAIRKRTKPGYVWLDADRGRRAAGLGYVGTPQGGAAFGIRNFWQSHPAQLDIRNAASEAAEVTLWLWSPAAAPMDLRFFHDGLGQDTHAKQLAAMDITYEDYEPGYATPHGVARTSEMRLWALPATPARAALAALAEQNRTPPQLACAPEAYLAAKVFGGLWTPPDRSTPFKARIEDQLEYNFDGYKKDIDQRRWYGFWHYGDFMHSYDGDRHAWRYDVGGFAWANSELSPDLWLWYYYLRTGRADVFRIAEAMTRHTGEVDVYHLGRFKGLGTRHGVTHWGDSSKQARISVAANRRFYYFLTADERVGDLLWEQIDIDRLNKAVDVGRKYKKTPTPEEAAAEAEAAKNAPPKPYPTSMNTGTDWGAAASATLAAWERTGEAKYGDKLRTSMESIAAMPNGFLHGGGGYDPDTGRFYANNDNLSTSHLANVFGAAEINVELSGLIDVPEFAQAWARYGRLYNAGNDEKKRLLGGRTFRQPNLRQHASRYTAYAAWLNKDPALAARAWREFMNDKDTLGPLPAITSIDAPDALNPLEEYRLGTNGVSQWSLAAMQCLRFIGDFAPDGEESEDKR